MSTGRTLLMDFIVEKLAAYKTPVRRGVPKGQKIGFSRTKYAAALFDLYDYSRPASQEIAGTLGTLAGNLKTTPHVIWQWRTEEEYRDRVASFAAEFCERFMEAIEAAFEKYTKATDLYATEQLVKPSLESHPPSIWADLQPQIADVIAYSFVLQVKIALAMDERRKKAAKTHDVGKLFLFARVARLFHADADWLKNAYEKLEQLVRANLFAGISETLSKSRPTRSDRKAALLALAHLREDLVQSTRAAKTIGSRNRGRK